jgi:2-amino-4-hydroxy-6-hydroxymethyldihydropteridine diphosphokinase
MKMAYIALGSNLGDREANLVSACRKLAGHPRIRLVDCSAWYLTEPVGPQDQDWFVNGAVAVETDLPPRELLNFLLQVELELGRVRTIPWGPRTLDLDLLFYGNEIIDEEGIIVPHPLLQQRRFVLEPLADMVPSLVHPLLGRTVTELMENLPNGERIVLQRKKESVRMNVLAEQNG